MNSYSKKKIILTFATPEHASIVHQIFSGKNMQKYSPVESVSESELRKRLKGIPPTFNKSVLFYRLMASIEGNIFGTFILKSWDKSLNSAEIGYGLLDPFQNKGLGILMVEKCLDLVFRETELQKIWASVHIDNIASIKILKKLNFTKMNEKDWSKNNKFPLILYSLDRSAFLIRENNLSTN